LQEEPELDLEIDAPRLAAFLQMAKRILDQKTQIVYQALKNRTFLTWRNLWRNPRIAINIRNIAKRMKAARGGKGQFTESVCKSTAIPYKERFYMEYI
jgi:hypothetical protein